MSHFLRAAAVVTAFALAASAAPAFAQCAFGHPKKAAVFKTSLTQAFLFCDDRYGGEPSPNTTTEGGIPACTPPETFDQLSGNPAHGWRFDRSKGIGQVQLNASRAFPVSPLDPPDNSADVRVRLKLSGVLEPLGPASGTGRLLMIFRMTLDDRAVGDTTVVDFPIQSDVPLVAGNARVQTTLDAILNAPPYNLPGLPKCSNLELLYVAVDDPNGDTLATAGLFLP